MKHENNTVQQRSFVLENIDKMQVRAGCGGSFIECRPPVSND
jgi:hypothetical protein